MDGDDVAEMSDEEYLKVFLEWMHRTRAKLRRRYGDRIVDIMTGQGGEWNRSGARYRDHVAPAKYQ